MHHNKNIPIATYRLQFNPQLTFQHARELLDYLQNLGISHCYASPIFKTRAGSLHGYDIVDHSKLNPELGSEDEFLKFLKSLQEHQMGLILDVVPNHMSIIDTQNQWWQDVLENGPTSIYAEYFDIDWQPPRLELHNKVLLPLLEQQYGEALENQYLKVDYRNKVFCLIIPNSMLPTDPKSWVLILEPVMGQVQNVLPEDNLHLVELQSIITSLHHLPAATEKDKDKIAERRREKEVIKRRLEKLLIHSEQISQILTGYLEDFNGHKGDALSFDRLEAFLKIQPYRLCFWRVANDEINYRRFFDISELAGILTEKPEVFEAIHSLVFDLVQKNLIDGLRIDHVDGLWDPEDYLQNLQKHCKPLLETEKDDNPPYIIVEKILSAGESLRSEWLVQGTVGYDFLNQLNGVFIHQSYKKAINDIYREFTGVTIGTFELNVLCKKLILFVSMSSELFVLARRLDRLAEQHRSSRDFTAESLRSALRDVIACFPVYRSYIRAYKSKIADEDRRSILTAISRAKYLNPAINSSIFDFIQNVLLLEHPQGLTEEQISERETFVMRFQQLTGPVMAKGIEDTASYRSYPLASLNEVGAEPYSFGISVEEFHKRNFERRKYFPHTMVTTSTHDSKRSEDVRARINVLSEIPESWEKAITHWSELNHHYKLQEGEVFIPDRNEEYLLYQTLIGTWPMSPMDRDTEFQYMKRIQDYMQKAIKEAKIHTSWINPNHHYDEQMQQFVQKVLNPDTAINPFLNEFKAFIPKIISAGMLNSLSQVLLKFTSPGVPDIYQGNEVWDFSLVDPDNRRPVNFAIREHLLKTIQGKKDSNAKEMIKQFMLTPEDGRIKLFLTMQCLKARQQLTDLFSGGEYLPLVAEGDKAGHVIAFARVLGGKFIIAIASRFFIPLMDEEKAVVDSSKWAKTKVILPEILSGYQWQNVITDEKLTFDPGEEKSLNLAKVFNTIPWALLENMER